MKNNEFLDGDVLPSIIPVPPKLFTVEEYHRLKELGFFSEHNRVELIRGEIIPIAAKTQPHSACTALLSQELLKLLQNSAIIRSRQPIILPPSSQPEPDITIAKNIEHNFLSCHPQPADILLVIEIAASTLYYDRVTKLGLYAESGIADYWLFNLVENKLECYSQPYQGGLGKFDYGRKRIYLPNSIVALPTFPDLKLNLSSVFSGSNR